LETRSVIVNRAGGVRLPLSTRKTNLARLLARRPDGIFVAPFEQSEIGPDLFRAACGMGLEGLVSKRAMSPFDPNRTCIDLNQDRPAALCSRQWNAANGRRLIS